MVAGFEVQAEIPAGPLTTQLVTPVGPVAPVVPVTVAVKSKLEPSAPPPVTTPVVTIVGVALGTTTSAAARAPRDR